MAQNLLWEIGIEEIPARFLPPAIKQMGELAQEALAKAGLPYDKLNIYATPRRLTLMVQGLAERSADTQALVKGPAKTAAFDDTGAPTRALQGFCKSQGLEPSDLIEQELNGNIYMYANKKTAGKDSLLLLPEILLYTVEKLYFPKPMRWGYNTLRFARPVRWLVALFGDQVIDVSFGGIAADRFSRGHRLLGSDHIRLDNADQYIEELRKNYVIVDQEERRELCRRQINTVAESFGGYVKEDEELLEEITCLVEYPTALAGTFDEKYLAIPEELVTTPMVDQQRYFPVYGKDDHLLPIFITVRNGDSRHLKIVAEGNEKVLRARLADAEFFYNEDIKDDMCEKVEELKSVVFHEKLGTSRQKVERFSALAQYIGKSLVFSAQELEQTARAAYLAKADLGSRVVYEFPELQGIIGEYYALSAGEDHIVAAAIREHYLPRFAGDDLPETRPGMAVALADRLDSLAGFFLMGIIPSGSQDPYALRRAAAGCAQMIHRYHLALSGADLLKQAAAGIEAHVSVEQDKKAERLTAAINFLEQRIENILAEEGISYDILNAIRPTQAGHNCDIPALARRAYALRDARDKAEFISMLAALTRGDNLLRNAEHCPGRFSPCGCCCNKELPAINTALFTAEVEKTLYESICELEKAAEKAFATDDINAVLAELIARADIINDFFEGVMVMDKDEAVKKNRLDMLCRLMAVCDHIADFSKLVEKK